MTPFPTPAPEDFPLVPDPLPMDPRKLVGVLGQNTVVAGVLRRAIREFTKFYCKTVLAGKHDGLEATEDLLLGLFEKGALLLQYDSNGRAIRVFSYDPDARNFTVVKGFSIKFETDEDK